MQSVVHPTIFLISGMRFQVVAQIALTDQQAAKVAMRFYRMRKFTKKDQGKLFQVLTSIDHDSITLF
jgi:hypothetical protein